MTTQSRTTLALTLLCGTALAGEIVTDALVSRQRSDLGGIVNIGPAMSPTNGMALYYSFDTNAAPVVDESGLGNTGTVNAATWTNAGRFGGAYFFNGSSSYVQASDSASLDLTGAFSIVLWVKTTTTNGTQALVAKHDDVSQRAYFAILDSSYPTLQISSDGGGGSIYDARTTAKVATTNWMHLAFVWGGAPNAGIVIYLNGNSQSLTSYHQSFVGTTLYNSALPLRIGAKSNGGWYFSGLLDDVRVYNRALAASEVSALYSSAAPTVTNELGVSVSATFSGTTTIYRLAPQGDLGMGSFTNGP